jgi:Fe2+ or Zn2+ uptake regulation protein
MKDYHNTNRESGEVLESSRRRARQQQERVLAFFQAHPIELYTREEIHRLLFSEGTPFTSVQRCLSNLTDVGKLQKTEMMRVSSFNKMVHTWRLSPAQPIPRPEARSPQEKRTTLF